MKVLIACEFSGVVREAFRARGHEAYSCDILPTRSSSGREFHIQSDVTDVLKQRWDLVIAHPPCTYLSKIGARWRAKDLGRTMKMLEAVEFFKQCLNANADRVCVENPIMYLDVMEKIGVRPTQKICPSQFGHEETKATYLWLRGLPKLIPTDVREVVLVGKPGQRDATSRIGRSGYNGLLRSVTYQGIADAMASQWGSK